MRVKKSKKYADGGPLQPKPVKKPSSKDSVPSEMFPGKMIPKSAVRKGPYITEDKKAAPAKAAPKKKMKGGGSLKPVAADQKGLAKLPTPVRNKMGYQKTGGKTKKAMGGMKMMKGGGKCKYGC